MHAQRWLILKFTHRITLIKFGMLSDIDWTNILTTLSISSFTSSSVKDSKNNASVPDNHPITEIKFKYGYDTEN